MIITYFRSSSYNTWDICQQQYFLSYNLGIPQHPNKKAEKGTMTHKVLECLAAGKLALQNGENKFVDDALGEVGITEKKLFNDDFIDTLCDAAFYHYQRQSPNTFSATDQRDIHTWTFKTLEEYRGMLDPRKRDIVVPEVHFDFPIEEDWAKYDYINPVDGRQITGQLHLKGTIDLTTQLSPDVYEIIDWKTGRRLDWAKNEPKTFTKLSSDPQLSIYHLALHKVFPDIDTFIMTIHYINDGGPYTMAYERSDIPNTLELLRERFEEIQNCKRPKLKSLSGKHFFCNKICHYGKNQHEDNPEQTICRYMRDQNLRLGMDEIVRKYTHEGFNVDFYSNPGE